MTNIDETRKRLKAVVAIGGDTFASHDDIRTVLDALDAAERERDEESGRANDAIIREGRRTDERDAALAVIERALVALQDRDGDPTGRIERILRAENILSAAPADALRAVKAEAWFAGYDKGNLDGYFGTNSERAHSPYADLDPYRETKEQD